MDIIKKDYEGGNSQIVLYQPNETISIEVKLDVEYDTVWLTQQQMVELFASSKANISEHISNIFQQCELQPESTVRKFRIVRKEGARTVTRTIDHYNLDVIISVGFRVNSRQGISFRQWANKVLKEYLLRGYAVHQQIKLLERRVEDKFLIQHDELRLIRERQDRQQEQLDFFIRTSAPPAEMVFFEGDFYTARAALENLVKSALHRVVIIDGYVSALTLDILDVRAKGVEAVIYTSGVGAGMQRLMQEHDRLFPAPEEHIDIRKWRKESHDRWLVIDDKLYHCGHSLNANGGHKISAITLMGTSPEVILGQVR
ncbi:MAG: RhuM family protein [Bacteroidales bacterium]|nr:RhuM family protein [Bacteroidales bacterium]